MEKQEIYSLLNQAYFVPNCHEKDVLDHLPAILRDRSLIVDVGASLGQYTCHINRHIRGSEIFAIEADPTRAEELARNCQKWAQDSDNTLTVLNMALSDKIGELPYYVTHSDVSGGLFQHATQRPVEWEEIKIQGSTLDELFPERVPDLVKMDVEGVELRILKGAGRILSARKTLFLIEVHWWEDPQGQKNPEEVRQWMRAHGYRSAQFFGQHLFIPSTPMWLKMKAWELWEKLRTRLYRLKVRLLGRQP